MTTTGHLSTIVGLTCFRSGAFLRRGVTGGGEVFGRAAEAFVEEEAAEAKAEVREVCGFEGRALLPATGSAFGVFVPLVGPEELLNVVLFPFVALLGELRSALEELIVLDFVKPTVRFGGGVGFSIFSVVAKRESVMFDFVTDGEG